MSFRSKGGRRPKLSPRHSAALACIEIPDCGCKLSMMPVCLIGAQPGCRQRRNDGECACRTRQLPSCQLDEIGGCAKRRKGKRCACPLQNMPECLSPGCHSRRKGRLCDCPRWPGEPCQHITSDAAKQRFFQAALILEEDSPRGSDIDSGWAFLLWYFWPREYRGPCDLGAAANLIDRETRIAMMGTRHALGLQIRHPQDVIHADAASHGKASQPERNFLYHILGDRKRADTA